MSLPSDLLQVVSNTLLSHAIFVSVAHLQTESYKILFILNSIVKYNTFAFTGIIPKFILDSNPTIIHIIMSMKGSFIIILFIFNQIDTALENYSYSLNSVLCNYYIHMLHFIDKILSSSNAFYCHFHKFLMI